MPSWEFDVFLLVISTIWGFGMAWAFDETSEYKNYTRAALVVFWPILLILKA